MTIGERIRQARKRVGMTQKQLGEVSGTSETTVKQYELGKRTPRLEHLQRIADALEVPVWELMDSDAAIRFKLKFINELQAQQPDRPYEPQGEQMGRLVKYASQLNEAGQQRVGDYARDLSKIDEYRRQEPAQPPPLAPEGTDPTPAAKPTEGPQEGE